MERISLGSMEVFLFDLDGCLYYGDVPARGALPLLELLRVEGKRCFFVTNNSTHTGEEIAARLNRMGLPATPDQVIAATELTGFYIGERYGRQKVKVAGSDSLRISLERAGHRVLPDDSLETADIVVVGRDTQFHYGKLQWIAAEEELGAKIVGTNPDAYHLGSQGEKVPETGALTVAIEQLIGKKIEYVGKPAAYLFDYVVKKHRLKAECCVMVGDNINTDMAGGVKAGMRTVWVRGEENSFIPDPGARGVQPEMVVESVEQLLDIYQKEGATRS